MNAQKLDFFLQTGSSCTKTQEIEEIKMLYVFDYFQAKGYTTATASTQFDDFTKQNIDKIKVEQEDCNHFNNILKGIKSKKHTQTKLGIDIVFIELKTEKNTIKAVICSSELVLDLTNNKEYWINDKEQQKWLSEFVNKIKYAQSHTYKGLFGHPEHRT